MYYDRVLVNNSLPFQLLTPNYRCYSRHDGIHCPLCNYLFGTIISLGLCCSNKECKAFISGYIETIHKEYVANDTIHGKENK